jgi:cell division protein FtsL
MSAANLKPAEEEIFYKKNQPLLYLVNRQEENGKERIIQTRSGLFYVMIIVVFFSSMAVLLNIGLKIQAINYERKIIDANELISVEKERSDRLALKVSELTSPARIITSAQQELGMQISDKIKVMEISGSGLAAQEKVLDYIANKPSAGLKGYDSFLGTINSLKDIVMVVSEGVLTFFIP